MVNRSKHLTLYSILFGIIIFLIGTNIMSYNRIQYLEKCLCENTMWLSAFEFQQIQNEIQRLEKETKSVLK